MGPVGCFLLNIAANVPGAKSDPEVLQLLGPLEKLGGAGETAVRQLKVLLAGVMATTAAATPAGAGGGRNSGGTSDSNAGGEAEGHVGVGTSVSAAAASGGMVALEDLCMQAGGRHDNDDAEFRDIKIMVTSQEVRGEVDLRGRGAVPLMPLRLSSQAGGEGKQQR